MDAAHFRALVEVLKHAQNVNYVNVASITVLALDYFLTLDLEVELIWYSKWSVTKILFLITRYLPFVDCSLVLYHQFKPNITAHGCDLAYRSSAWLFIIGVSLAEIILTLRTWAVWGKDRRLMIALPIIYVAIWTVGYTIIGIFLNTIEYGKLPFPQITGCFVTAASPILFVCWIVLMVYDAVILGLMIFRGFSFLRNGFYSELLKVVYRDGIIYYLYLFVMSLVNVVVILKLPHDYVNLLSMIERVSHSVLTCRVVLHVRELGRKTTIIGTQSTRIGDSSGTSGSTSIKFRPQGQHTSS